MGKRIKVAMLVVDDRFASPAPVPRFGASPTALFQGFERFSDEVEIHVVSCMLGEQPCPERLAENIWFHGESIPKWGYWKTLYGKCFRAVNRMVREIEPDIVHAQGSERWCAVTGAVQPYPKILTIHGNLAAIDPLMKPRPRHYWKLQTALQKLSLPRFDGVFCNSDYTRDCLEGPAKKTWRVNNPVRGEFFVASTESVRPPGPVKLLNVGVFQTRKRQFDLLLLARRLHDEGVNLCVRFIGHLGGDEYGRRCRELLDDGESRGYAEYVGTKSAEELVHEMDRVPGMVHCPEEEAFGLVVAESLARGQKFFGSEVGGIKDITSDVPGCELFERGDWNGMGTAIRRWIEQGASRAPDAAPIMVDRYEPGVIARQHVEIYRELLESAQGRVTGGRREG